MTPAQMQQMAAKYKAEKTTIVVVGDRKVIAEQVAPYEKAS